MAIMRTYNTGGLSGIGSYEGDFGRRYDANNPYTYGQEGFTGVSFGNSGPTAPVPPSAGGAITGTGTRPSSGLIANTFKPRTARDEWDALPWQVQKYYIKKGAVVNKDGYLEGISSADLLKNINAVNRVKGGSPVTSFKQVPDAAGPLIAKRQKRGIGGLLGAVAPIALSFLAPGIGTALGSALSIGSGLGTALAGAGLGAIGSGITGGNPLTGALLGGAGGAFQGFGGLSGLSNGAVRAVSGPMAGQMVIPGVLNTAQGIPMSLGSTLGMNAARAATGFEGLLGRVAAGGQKLGSLGNLGNLGKLADLAGALSGQAPQQQQAQPQLTNEQIMALLAQVQQQQQGGQSAFMRAYGRAPQQQQGGQSAFMRAYGRARGGLADLGGYAFGGMTKVPYGQRPGAATSTIPASRQMPFMNPNMNNANRMAMAQRDPQAYAAFMQPGNPFNSMDNANRMAMFQNVQRRGFADGGHTENNRIVKGPGDGMSDSIPAVVGGVEPVRIADGEHIVPSLQVAMLGRGSGEAGSKRIEELVQKEITKMYGRGVDPVALQDKAMMRK